MIFCFHYFAECTPACLKWCFLKELNNSVAQKSADSCITLRYSCPLKLSLPNFPTVVLLFQNEFDNFVVPKTNLHEQENPIAAIAIAMESSSVKAPGQVMYMQ